jgi:hypothetical protein
MEIKDIKTKIIIALGDIDLSKLTLAELQTYVDIAGKTETLAREVNADFYDLYSKLCENLTTCATPKKLSEMKGE